MDLGALETNVTTWVETLSGLKVHWRRQSPKALRHPYVEAELLAIAGKGIDEQFRVFDSATQQNVLTMTGLRNLTISLHFLSLDQALGNSARQHAENFRTQLLRPSSLDFLYASNLSLVGMLTLADADYVDKNNRLVSKVTVDVGFELRSSIADPVDAGDWIETVFMTPEQHVVDEFCNPVVDESGDYVVTEPAPAVIASALPVRYVVDENGQLVTDADGNYVIA